MLHVFHAGPLVLGERRLWLLSAARDDGGFIHPLVGPDLPSALASLSARRGPENLRVEPALEAVAAPLGIAAEELPDFARVPRAVQAFAFATSRPLFRYPSAVAAFLEACDAFARAAPWSRFASNEPLEILMTERRRCWKREFLVRGSSTEPQGLELHEKPGVPDLLVTFQGSPPWALEALRAAYGLAQVPTVIRMRPGSRQAPEARELLQLAAALRCAAILSAEDITPEHAAVVALSADPYALEALAAPPAGPAIGKGARAPTTPTPRNAPCPCGSGLKFKRCHATRSDGSEPGERPLPN